MGDFLKTKEGQKAAADLRKALMADPKGRAFVQQAQALEHLHELVGTGRSSAEKGGGCLGGILIAALLLVFMAIAIIR